jgi:hypothetical protein
MRTRQATVAQDDTPFGADADPQPEPDDEVSWDEKAGREDEGEATGPGRRFQWLAALGPVLPILAAQGYFAARLLVTNTAFIDEATYMYAGHQEISHIVHGSPVASYETFFSGAPIIYPMLSALAAALHGVVAARIFSLACMLLATVAVYLTGRRMYGTLAGFFAAALFAALGPTLHLSSYATFDAMALCLLAWSTWCAVAFAYGDRRDVLVYGPLLMVLADCTKYASLLWNPVIIALAGLAGPGFSAWKVSRWWNVQRFALVSGGFLLVAVLAGREPYFTGFDKTTLQRQPSNSTAAEVAQHAAQWVGPLLAVGLLGLIVLAFGSRSGRTTAPEVATAGVLLFAGLLAPLNQLRIHTLLSLEKHADIGASFTAILAGYLIARLCGPLRMNRAVRAVTVTLAVCVSVLPLGYVGVAQAKQIHDSWPDSTQLVDTLRPLVHRGSDNYLVEDYDVPAFYLGGAVHWQQWHDTVSASWKDPTTGAVLTGVPAFKAAIAAHHYQVIVLDFAETPATDVAIRGTITKSGYRLVARIPTQSTSGKGAYYIWDLPGGAQAITPATSPAAPGPAATGSASPHPTASPSPGSSKNPATGASHSASPTASASASAKH